MKISKSQEGIKVKYQGLNLEKSNNVQHFQNLEKKKKRSHNFGSENIINKVKC